MNTRVRCVVTYASSMEWEVEEAMSFRDYVIEQQIGVIIVVVL